MIRVFVVIFGMYTSSVHADELNIDPYVSDIVTVGEWTNSNEKGQYRFITKTYGSEHVFSKLFIQWLSYHIDGESRSEVIAEAPVKELNNKYYSFTSPECKGDWKCQYFDLSTTDAFTYKNHKFKLIISSPGKYALSEYSL